MEDGDKIACRLLNEFEENPTYDTFYKLCKSVSSRYTYQCTDSLVGTASKIPIPELKKIMTFIADIEVDPSWTGCELSIEPIIQGHKNQWLTMSLERLESLMPFLNESFWNYLADYEPIYEPSEMSVMEFNQVLNTILKPHV